jgi:hypothetical protein
VFPSRLCRVRTHCHVLVAGLPGRGVDTPTWCTRNDAAAVCLCSIRGDGSRCDAGIRGNGVRHRSIRGGPSFDGSSDAIVVSRCGAVDPQECSTWSTPMRLHLLCSCSCAIDSTPLRVMDPVRMGWMAIPRWTHSDHIPSFNLHLAVAPNGIYMAISALLAGGRHDKRALDDRMTLTRTCGSPALGLQTPLACVIISCSGSGSMPDTQVRTSIAPQPSSSSVACLGSHESIGPTLMRIEPALSASPDASSAHSGSSAIMLSAPRGLSWSRALRSVWPC